MREVRLYVPNWSELGKNDEHRSENICNVEYMVTNKVSFRKKNGSDIRKVHKKRFITGVFE